RPPPGAWPIRKMMLPAPERAVPTTPERVRRSAPDRVPPAAPVIPPPPTPVGRVAAEPQAPPLEPAAPAPWVRLPRGRIGAAVRPPLADTNSASLERVLRQAAARGASVLYL